MQEVRKKILVVDDEVSVRESLSLLLKTNFDVEIAADGSDGLSKFELFNPDLVLLDMQMPQLDGLQTLKAIREKSEQIPIVMLTATNTAKSAVQAMKHGASDYVNKPFDIEELTAVIVSLLEHGEGTHLSKKPSKEPTPKINADFGPMVGRSQVMVDLFKSVSQIAERSSTVLITGESGTGKELVARQIHDLSPRKNAPFVAINCAAIPETLIESELFGHERGAFTNAIEKRIGHFEQANGGTLFLDEIGELSTNIQVKMLRFLQEQEFYRIGRSKPVQVDVRIIAATNQNLETLVAEKKFRQDLFYRIHVIKLPLPALRDRFEDIPNLITHFINQFAPLYNSRNLSFSADALSRMVEYEWPGNVRELENVIESLMALAPNDNLSADDLPRKILSKQAASIEQPKSMLKDNVGFEEAEKMFETEMIVKALRKANYVQTRAAEILGISRRILKYKMDKLGISDKSPT